MTKRPLYAEDGTSKTAAAPTEPTLEQLRTVIIASSAGTAFEWYDFFIFGTLSAIIAKNFFAGVSDTTGLILAFLVFGAGFIARPFGALVFGHFGDRIGRKVTFIVTISVMGLCTFVVGLLPNFAQIGVAAPIALVGLRLLQGFAIGGEYGGAAIYVAEHAPHNKRGLLTSWIQTSAAVGYGGAVAIILLTRTILGEDAFAAWGWRVPFLSSALLFLASLYIRVRIGESPVFERIKAEGAVARAPLLESFFKWENLKIAIIALCSIMIAQGTLWYTAHFYAQVFIERTLKVPGPLVNEILIIAVAISAPMYVFWGWLSDKIGRKPIMLFGIFMGTVGFFPGFHMLTEAGNPALPHGTSLYPFAGGLCLFMSILTPKLMKVSTRIADGLGRAVPRWLGFGGMLVQRALTVELSPEDAVRHGRSPGLLAATLALLVAALALIGTFRHPDWTARAVLTAVALAIWAVHAGLTRRGLRGLGQSIDLTGLNVLSRDRVALTNYVSSTISCIMLIGVLVAVVFPMGPIIALLVPAAIIPVILAMSKRVYVAAVEPPMGMHAREMLDNQMRADGLEARRRGGGGRP